MTPKIPLMTVNLILYVTVEGFFKCLLRCNPCTMYVQETVTIHMFDQLEVQNWNDLLFLSSCRYIQDVLQLYDDTSEDSYSDGSIDDNPENNNLFDRLSRPI